MSRPGGAGQASLDVQGERRACLAAQRGMRRFDSA